jgi:hypothetical protein
MDDQCRLRKPRTSAPGATGGGCRSRTDQLLCHSGRDVWLEAALKHDALGRGLKIDVWRVGRLHRWTGILTWPERCPAPDLPYRTARSTS